MKIFFAFLLIASNLFAQDTTQKIQPVYPKTINQAVDTLMKILSVPDKMIIQVMEKKDLIRFHHGLGAYIRSRFYLWSENKELVYECADSSKDSIPHPDNASNVILEYLRERLQLEKYDYIIPDPVIIDSVNCSDSIEYNDCILELKSLSSKIEYPKIFDYYGFDYSIHASIIINKTGSVDSIIYDDNSVEGFKIEIDNVLKTHKFDCIVEQGKELSLNFVIRFDYMSYLYYYYKNRRNN